MKRACIVTIDAARARIFLYNENAKPGFELIEYKDLDNPGRRLRTGETVSEPSAQFDDHRDAHVLEADRAFARDAIDVIGHVLHDKQLGRLVVCAAPKMLGVVRSIGAGVLERPDLVVEEIQSNLSTLTVAVLHDRLSQLDVIPARARLSMAR